MRGLAPVLDEVVTFIHSRDQALVY
jgi:hypothetical protein